jgi:hypothetical protein
MFVGGPTWETIDLRKQGNWTHESPALRLLSQNTEKVIKEITDRMRKLAYVPIQTWRGWDPNDLFGGWFSALGGFKTLIGAMGLCLGVYLIFPCLVPLVLWCIKTIMEAVIKGKNGCTCNDAIKIQTPRSR